MKTSLKIVIAVVITAAFAVAVGFAFSYAGQARRYRLAYENSCRRSFASLCENVSGIDAALSKSCCINDSTLLAYVASEIYARSEAAKCALAELPGSELSLDKTQVFISQAGDYALALARKPEVTAEDREALKSMSATASQISSSLSELLVSAGAEGFFDAVDDSGAGSYAGGMGEIESGLPESPVLIYDGPYSSHITKAVPAYLSGGKAVSAVEASRVAAVALGAAESELSLISSSSDPVIYTFSEPDGAGYAAVTQIGGHLLAFTKNVAPGASVYTCDQAVQRASDWLASNGFPDMTASYHYSQGGICYINFACSVGGVIIYPDLVQAGVALDTGDVVYLQAEGYLNNHRDRGVLAASLSVSDAAGTLGGLTLKSDGRLCVIPSSGKNELLCWEFHCSAADGSGDYLVYVNASGGAWENIFILSTDASGTLTR